VTEKERKSNYFVMLNSFQHPSCRKTSGWARNESSNLLPSIFAFLVGSFAGSWLDDRLDIDSCLDAGGAWNYDYGLCDLK
jgi:hypothetical protein